MSPMISSSENSTAAIGVLNAAASAADAPTGTSHRTCAVLSPSRRAMTDAMPAPMWTDGPSRPERDAAGERRRAADELSEHRAEGNAAVVDEDRRARLRNPAASRVGKEAEQQIAGDERTERRNENPPPARAAGRVHVGREPPGQQNERDDDRADERADHEAQQQREPVLPAAEILDQVPVRERTTTRVA